MIEINLVPDVKQELIKAQRIRSTVITFSIMVGVVAVGIVVALAFYIFAVQAVRSGILDGSIDSSNKKLLSINTDKNPNELSKILTIQNQLTKITALNDNKKINSRIFELLNAIIPPAPNDIQISDLSIDSSSSTVTINGQASNSYAAVEVFKKTLGGAKVRYNTYEDKKFTLKTLSSNISTSNTSYGEDSSGKKVLRFTLSFEYTDELFSPLSKNVSVIISNKGNVTDSYLGVPKSIFTDRATDITGAL